MSAERVKCDLLLKLQNKLSGFENRKA